MGKRADRFVVGYPKARNCIYGKRHFSKDIEKDIAIPMTLAMAKRVLPQVACWEGEKRVKGIIYELREVKEKGGNRDGKAKG